MKSAITLLVLCICLIGCSGESERLEKERKHNEAVTQFQSFIDKQYPKWQVKGYRQNINYLSTDMDNAYYSILLTDGTTEREIILREGTFTGKDGTNITRLDEPSKDELDRLAIRKAKSKCGEERNGYEPEQDDPQV